MATPLTHLPKNRSSEEKWGQRYCAKERLLEKEKQNWIRVLFLLFVCSCFKTWQITGKEMHILLLLCKATHLPGIPLQAIINKIMATLLHKARRITLNELWLLALLVYKMYNFSLFESFYIWCPWCPRKAELHFELWEEVLVFCMFVF